MRTDRKPLSSVVALTIPRDLDAGSFENGLILVFEVEVVVAKTTQCCMHSEAGINRLKAVHIYYLASTTYSFLIFNNFCAAK